MGIKTDERLLFRIHRLACQFYDIPFPMQDANANRAVNIPKIIVLLIFLIRLIIKSGVEGYLYATAEHLLLPGLIS